MNDRDFPNGLTRSEGWLDRYGYPPPEGVEAVLELGTKSEDWVFGDEAPALVGGGGGSDWLEGRAGADTLVGGKMFDTLLGGADGDRLFGGRRADTMTGGEGGDRVAGQGGHDLIAGAEGADTLLGGRGKDTIHGGAGNDILRGGRGADCFVFGASNGADVIRDYQARDTLVFRGEGTATVEQVGADAVVRFGETVVTVRDARAETLTLDTGPAGAPVPAPPPHPSPRGEIRSGQETLAGQGLWGDVLIGTEGRHTFFTSGRGDDTIVIGGGAMTVEQGDGVLIGPDSGHDRVIGWGAFDYLEIDPWDGRQAVPPDVGSRAVTQIGPDALLRYDEATVTFADTRAAAVESFVFLQVGETAYGVADGVWTEL